MPAARSAPIAVTMGEPAGIGGEITLKAWQRRAEGRPFFVIDDPDRLRALALRLGLNVEIFEIDRPSQCESRFATALPVLPITLNCPVEPGTLDLDNEAAVIESIDRAVRLAESGEVSAIVTNPIHKGALIESGFPYPGHTEYLAAKVGVDTPVMLLASTLLKVVPVTVHQPLAQAIRDLSTEKIVRVIRQTAMALSYDFGIEGPRIALAGLNPHAGENGKIGSEEQTIIAPAIDTLRNEGINVAGPYAPDSMFHEEARKAYDVAICMYHDQALIPLKTLSFDDGVNVTLGLPFVRTSPDHGTGLDIAGLGLARESSMLAALELAAQIATMRAANAAATRD